MKAMVLSFALAGVCLGQTSGDIPQNPVVPATPRKFDTRSVGPGGGAGVDVSITEEQRETPETRKIQLIMVTESRVWTSADGREVRAAMLAYENGPVPKNSSAPLTLVRAGKIRLLLDQRKQITELPLEKLSKQDQEFVMAQVAARKQASQPKAEKQE